MADAARQHMVEIDPDFEPLSRPRSCTWPLPRPEFANPADSSTSSPAPSVKQEPCSSADFISNLSSLEEHEDYPDKKARVLCGDFSCQEACVHQQSAQQPQISSAQPAHPHPQQVCVLTSPAAVQRKSSSSRRNAWGNMSYADLITKAIESSPEKRLTLSQIYDWMVKSVPYFKDKGDSNSSAGWKQHKHQDQLGLTRACVGGNDLWAEMETPVQGSTLSYTSTTPQRHLTYTSTPSQLLLNYTSAPSQLLLSSISATSQLYLSSISATSQLYLSSISATSQLHLSYCSAPSQLLLNYTSAPSQLLLSYFSTIPQLHLSYFSTIPQLHLSSISATSKLYLSSISATSQLYLSSISATSQHVLLLQVCLLSGSSCPAEVVLTAVLTVVSCVALLRWGLHQSKSKASNALGGQKRAPPNLWGQIEKNSIRHNLSLHSRFVRVQNEGTGKSSWWMLNPEGSKSGKSPRRRAASMDNTGKFAKSRGRAAKKKVRRHTAEQAPPTHHSSC
ncbi:hypothetical protein P4O66_018092 [Electrophorus voltai]|uniref:Fork-head domain-containing protein n=1 Tax=Electrophorus voltai TaxID=2609070 RepID=A0AAD8YU09_9TELE|nr:hypothetical protein P4O66_018092 [Electrophorus voltai]